MPDNTLLKKSTKIAAKISVAPPRPVTIALRSLKCLIETDEVGADEPYMLVTACDVSGLIPAIEVTRYGPWSDTDKGETKTTALIPPNAPQALIDLMSASMVLRRPFWSLDNKSAKVIADPAKVIFIASLMENDDGDTSAMRTLVKAAATASLANSMSQPRDVRVSKLMADIRGALQIPTGAPNFDDPVQTRELKIGAADLLKCAGGKRHSIGMDFVGDGGKYHAVFDIVGT